MINLSRRFKHKLLFLTKPFFDIFSFFCPYPYTFINDFNKKLKLLNKTIQLNGNGGGWIFFTDFHTKYNSHHSNWIVKKIMEKTYINKCFFGGDVITLSTRTKKMAIKEHEKFIKQFNFPNFYFIYGNHDNNSHKQKSQNEILEIKSVMEIMFNKKYCNIYGENNSYYIDDEINKTRFLCLDTGKQYLLENDFLYIKEMLKSVSSGWHIIVITHIVYEYIDKQYQPRDYIKKLLDIFDNYNKSNYNGHIECIIGGHIHNDYYTSTKGGIPIIIQDSDAYLFSSNRFLRKRGHLSEQCVTVFIPDYKNHFIKIIRFGYGEDKVIELTYK